MVAIGFKEQTFKTTIESSYDKVDPKPTRHVDSQKKWQTEGERIITLLKINYGTFQVLKWILVEIEHLKNWMLMLRQIVIKNMKKIH